MKKKLDQIKLAYSSSSFLGLHALGGKACFYLAVEAALLPTQ